MREVESTDMYTEQPTNSPIPEAAEAEKNTEKTIDVTNESAVAIKDTAEDTVESHKDEQAAPTDADIIAQLQTDLVAAQAKSDELVDKLQRSAAEFQNSRRRQEKQLADEIERASTHILQRLLPVIDDLDLAFQNIPTEVEQNGGGWLEGLRQIQKKLTQLLEDRGVTAIAKEGPFDPSRHEAVSSEPNETVESGHIIQTLRTGYEHKDRVLRPALVRVSA